MEKARPVRAFLLSWAPVDVPASGSRIFSSR